MPTFTYKARTKNGELVTGTLEAGDEKAGVIDLDRLGYSVVEIAQTKSRDIPFAEIFERFNRLDRQEVIIFTRQLATLLRSGLALSPSLSTVCEQTVNRRFRTILEDVRQSVQSGSSFSEALSKYPEAFSEFFVSMVRVGEAAGILDKVLDRLARLGTQEMEINSRIKSALIYPMVLVVVAFFVVSFLLIGVLPKFVAIFRASQASLPLPTQIVLFLSIVLRRLWPVMILFGLFGIVWFRGYISREAGRLKFHNWLLTVPIFGKLYTKIQISRFARLLSNLTSSGIPILQGLTVVEKTITNLAIRRAIQKIRAAITEGKPLAEPFRSSGYFSPMVVQMVSTGERSGTLDDTLQEIANFYEPEIEYTIKNLTSLLEPFMLLSMGITVAFIALSVLLPIFNMIKLFRS